MAPAKELQRIPPPADVWGVRYALRKESSSYTISLPKGLGGRKTLQKFSLTDEGWSAAWRSFAQKEPAYARQHLERLGLLESQAEREQRTGKTLFIGSFTFLGGYGIDGLTAGTSLTVVFSESGLDLDSATVKHVSYDAISEIETSGRGRITEGGGFVGGGFGLEGAAQGILIATALNSLTSKTHMETVLHVLGPSLELFLHHSDASPEQLRISLSPVIGRLPQHLSAVAETPAVDLVQQLKELGQLRDAGVLDDDEFRMAKQKLLGGAGS